MVDLQLYCSSDPYRTYLHKPFSSGAFSYGANGHIMVRVPRNEGIPEQTKQGEWDRAFKALPDATFSTLSHKPIPEHPLGPCQACDGRGFLHNCPDCECECERCHGHGTTYPDISTTIRGQLYALRYVAMILALPGVQIADKTEPACPLLFKFDGGDGAVMPRTRQGREHIEIEISSD